MRKANCSSISAILAWLDFSFQIHMELTGTLVQSYNRHYKSWLIDKGIRLILIHFRFTRFEEHAWVAAERLSGIDCASALLSWVSYSTKSKRWVEGMVSLFRTASWYLKTHVRSVWLILWKISKVFLRVRFSLSPKLLYYRPFIRLVSQYTK